MVKIDQHPLVRSGLLLVLANAKETFDRYTLMEQQVEQINTACRPSFYD